VEAMAYMHCAVCLQERPDTESPREYARLSVGVDGAGGLIVWCNRHDILVVNWSNDEVAKQLNAVGGERCASCGGACKETMH
jgi:hypothetical protein